MYSKIIPTNHVGQCVGQDDSKDWCLDKKSNFKKIFGLEIPSPLRSNGCAQIWQALARKIESCQQRTPWWLLLTTVPLIALLTASISPVFHLTSKPIALRLVVITGGARVDSLYRLLESLCSLESDGDRLDLDVWIDVPEGVPPEGVLCEKRQMAADIENMGTNGTYKHGIVRAHIWEKHMGLRGQWLDAWHASTPGGLTETTKEIGLIIEDDLELSPLAWRWLKAAHAEYGADQRIAGFTLQRAHLCVAKCPDLTGGPDGAGGAFLYPLIGTWGYSPTAKSYARFREWYYSLPPDYKPYVEGLSPTEWYKSFEKAGTEKKRMWEMHHLKYTDTHVDKFTVYVKCPGNATLAVNHRELGLNYHKKEESPHHMLIDWHPDLVRFSRSPLVLNYSANVVGGVRP